MKESSSMLMVNQQSSKKNPQHVKPSNLRIMKESSVQEYEFPRDRDGQKNTKITVKVENCSVGGK